MFSLVGLICAIFLCASIFQAARATTNLSELRKQFGLLSQALGNIPECPPYDSLPNDILMQGVECTNAEAERLTELVRAGNTDITTYPGPCTSACRAFYAYFGANCLLANNEAIESFGKDLQETLASGSVPIGLDRKLILSLFETSLEEEYEFSETEFDYLLENQNNVMLSVLDELANGLAEGSALVESSIKTCDVPKDAQIASSRDAPHLQIVWAVLMIWATALVVMES